MKEVLLFNKNGTMPKGGKTKQTNKQMLHFK